MAVSALHGVNLDEKIFKKSVLVKFFEDDPNAQAYVMMIEPVLACSACEVSSEVCADKLLQELEVLPSGSR